MACEPAVDALEFDLAEILLPALEADPAAFRDAVYATNRRFQRRLSGHDTAAAQPEGGEP